MPRFEPLPERRPAIVAGASSGIGEATAIELAAHGFPVALGARRVEKLDDIVGKINADGGEAVGFHLDVTDPNSVKSFVAQSVRRARRHRGAGGRRRRHLLRQARRDHHRRLRLAVADPPGRRQPAGHRGAAGHDRPPARRPDLRRVRRRAASATAHGRLRRRQGRAGRDGHQPADGTRRHRRACVDRAPGPDEDRDGLEPAGREDRPRAGGLGQVGPGPPRLLPARGGSGTSHHVRRRDTARRLHREHGTSARGPVGRSPRTARNSHSAKRGCQDNDHSHSSAGVRWRRRTRPSRGVPHRPDRFDAAHPRRMRRRRLVPARRQARHPAVRRRGQRVLLPIRRRGSRPGRGVSVHDADLRQGRGVRRQPRAAQGDAAQLGAARRADEGPRRHHRGRSQEDDRQLGRRRRDRTARLLLRADHLHLDGLPDRSEVPRTARPPVRRVLPRTGARHRPAVLRRPVPADRELPAPRRGARETRCAGSGNHEPAASPTRRRTRRTATCSTCWCRSRTRRAIRGSPPTRSPACSSR